ncbi:MAG TPA: SUF system NifU family Fe-S cluster assembly protein [bacterium]|nr:SUF system NifU family Fe-S cluster assembly protein [bacterium]
MSEFSDLYQELILDHNKHPRNFGPLPDADRQAEGHNPLCGDNVTVYLKLGDGTLEDIHFEGSGCAISTASASLMTEALKGKSPAEAAILFDKFHHMVIGEQVDFDAPPALDKLEAFAGVSEFPVRVKCASLAWHTMMAALEGRDEPVTTEE